MDLVTRLFGTRKVLVPVVVGTVALLLAGAFGYLTLRADPEESSADAGDTRSFVSKRGGFALEVPRGLTVERKGRTATFSSQSKDLVLTVGPGGRGPLAQASREFVGTLRTAYQNLRMLGRERRRIDDRPALVAYGRATNASGVRLRFVAVVVRDRPRNYHLTAFTAFDSDPEVVLPRVNTIVNSFEIR